MGVWHVLKSITKGAMSHSEGKETQSTNAWQYLMGLPDASMEPAAKEFRGLGVGVGFTLWLSG